MSALPEEEFEAEPVRTGAGSAAGSWENSQKLIEWRNQYTPPQGEVPTEEELYDLTLRQIYMELTNHKTPKPIKQRYHMGILRWSDRFLADGSKSDAFMKLVNTVKGKDGTQSVSEHPEDQDEGSGSGGLPPELGPEAGSS